MTNTLPPGPRSALSQIFVRDPYPWMLDLGRAYADPVTCPILGQSPIVVVWSPEHVRAVFSADPALFTPGSNEALATIVGRGSMFMKSGEDHKRARKLLMPAFHGERMRAYGALMRESALRWARTIERGKSAPLLPIAQGITLDVIIEAIFGERDPERVSRLHGEILAIVAAFNPVIATFTFMQREFGGLGPWAKFRRRAEALETSMRALVQEKSQRPGEDILSLLLSARYDDGEAMPEREVLEQLLTFVVAGHETTATSLAWAMYELHRRPETLAKLRDEVGAESAPDALAKMTYLDAVCAETLRMHPPVPLVTRKLLGDFTLGAHTLPAGTVVGVGIYNAHNRAETFEAPGEFRPERFVQRTYSPFEYCPFGGGARRCLGAAFAMYELKIVLATLVSHGTFRLDEPAPVRHAFRIGTYGPETGVRMTLQ